MAYFLHCHCKAFLLICSLLTGGSLSVRKRPLAPGTHYCTSPITSIVRQGLNETSEEGWAGGLHEDQRQKGIACYPPPAPGDKRGVIHKRDSSNNGARGGVGRFLRSRCSGECSSCGRAGPGRGVRGTHMVLVWLRVEPGGKKGPGNRNPPILTSCFCWKGDPNTRPAHQH